MPGLSERCQINHGVPMNEQQIIKRALLDNPNVTFEKARPVLQYTGAADKLNTSEINRALALSFTEPFGIFKDKNGNRINWHDLNHPWLDVTTPRVQKQEVIEKTKPSEKENHHWNLVRQCLEDMFGKSSSEASLSEWKYAEEQLGWWLAERTPYPAPDKV